MLQRILFVFIFTYETKAVYQIFKEQKTWSEAQKTCQLINGSLAIVPSLDRVPSSWRQGGKEYWIGAHLNDQGFSWVTGINNNAVLIPLEPLVYPKGCYKPSSITGGHRITNISTEKCFNVCNWKGYIGLKSFFCICEDNIHNGTHIPESTCNVRCSGNFQEFCGGPKGVSLYGVNRKSVLWADNEPNDAHDCVYIKKQGQNQTLLWYTAACNTMLRYICYLEDDDICGIDKSCIRPSVQPSTWPASFEGCRLLGGSTAVVDVTMMYDDDIRHLSPGEYWVGLQRRRKWEFTNGLPLQSTMFLRRSESRNGKCVALSEKDGYLGLLREKCLDTRPFICQYEVKFGNSARSTKNNSHADESTTVITTSFVNYKYESADIETKKTGRMRRNESDPNDNTTIKGKDGRDYQTSLYKSIMYLAIGVASGMAIVFGLCVVVYVGKRCQARETEFKTVRYPKGKENPILRYNGEGENNVPKNHIVSDPEVVYEVPCDAQESPFRATQRILQQNYAIGRDGFPTNSWRRKKSDKESTHSRNKAPEIRHIHPYNNRTYGDTSYIIHNVRAQCHPNSNSNSRNTPVDITYTGSLDTRLRRPPSQQQHQNQQNNDVRLSETYSLPEQGRKLSEPIIHVDTSDLYACVQKALDSNQHDDYYDNSDSNVRVTLC